jgi:hypothetical protein
MRKLTPHHDGLSPITGVYPQLVQLIPTSPIENVYDSVITAADNDATVLGEAHLTGSLRSCDRNRKCANSSPSIKPVEGHTFTRLIDTEDSLSRVDCSVTTGTR